MRHLQKERILIKLRSVRKARMHAMRRSYERRLHRLQEGD
jgi:hypothetical protein